jgi:nitrite reductase (NADH) small subunit
VSALQSMSALSDRTSRADHETTDTGVRRSVVLWVRVCHLDDLERERGRAALIDGEQVALFRTHEDRLHAVQQWDPYSGAHVISRGIVGTRGDIPTVASPMYKQVFDLRTGACVDTQGKEAHTLRVWPAAVDANGDVFLRWKADS